MDFFEAQDRARRRTNRLVALFILAVVGTILSGYVAALMVTGYANRPTRHSRYAYASTAPLVTDWWNPPLFAGVTLGSLAVVAGASLFKWSAMRAGGGAIAESVGARHVDPRTTDLLDRRLLNVVEEMSIAAGVPMPAVYVMDDEPGINAFAAGLSTADAAVTVTRGTLEKLTRDELQGVVGHEFSHILNGDMRLNVRITAVIFGILVIGLIGRGLLQSLRYGRVRSDRKGGGLAAVVAIGLALLVIGYVGYFFGRLIQAAVSRQREFLADASAVQFTRNPGGIGGALKKIGGYALGSDVLNHDATQFSHFFFAQGFRSSFGGWWATHPPVGERIRAIEPTWDGKLFEPHEVVDIARESAATAGFGGGHRFDADETVRRVAAAPADVPPPLQRPAPLPFKPVQVVADTGALTAAHFRRAQVLLESIPARLRDAARDPASAQVLVYGLLLTGEPAARERQQQIVQQRAGAEAAATLATLRPALSIAEPATRLPLLQLALPALRTLAVPQLEQFAGTLDELVHADGRVSPFEFALQKMLLSQLARAQTPHQPVQFDSFAAVRREIAVVLSALAHVGGETQAAAAFAAGAGQLPMLAGTLALLAPADCGLDQVDAALDKLAVSSLPIRRRLLEAAGHVVASDGTITEEEGELFRALAATVDLPMPQLAAA